MHGERLTLDRDIIDELLSAEDGQAHSVVIMSCGEPQTITFSANHIDEITAALEVTSNL